MFLRPSRPSPRIPGLPAILAGMTLFAVPAANGQGGLIVPLGVQATPTSLSLDHTASVRVTSEPEAEILIDPPFRTPGWTPILFEGGGDFPAGNGWNVFDSDPASGDDYWDDVLCRPFAGNWSIWCADIENPDCTTYDNDMFAWMIFGPFSLADAADARVLYAAWSQVEDDFDTFFVGASINGTNFFGSTVSQDFDWTQFTFDLTDVFNLGDLMGQPAVWLAFVFTSDGSGAIDEGVYLDDILVEKLAGLIFADGFESGDTTMWSSGVP